MSSRSTTVIADKDGREGSPERSTSMRSMLENIAFFRFLTRWTEEQYRPEKYYMRGPGPKAKAKAVETKNGKEYRAQPAAPRKPPR